MANFLPRTNSFHNFVQTSPPYAENLNNPQVQVPAWRPQK